MHLEEGQLRAYADQGLAAPERAAAAAHLASCDECRRRAQQLTSQSERVHARLQALAPATDSTDVSAALSRFRERRDLEKKEQAVFKRIFSRQFRFAWISLAAIALALVALSFEPVQAWAGQFLSLFRAQQVVVLPVDTTGLTQLSDNQALARQISQLISKSVTVTKKPAKPQTVDSAASASKLAGFNVRLPSSQTDKPRLTVLGGTAFQVVADRAKAQAVLNETGHSDLVLPASLDGAEIKVNIPNSVNAGYGDCPAIQIEGQTNLAKEPVSRARGLADCVTLVEMPSPTVDAPPTVNVQQLAEMGLQFTGMSAEQARAYSQTVDWTSTLVIPIPKNGASYKQVNVDGVKGFLIQRPVEDAPGYALVWVKGGIIYAIAGTNSNSQKALDMANSLH